MPERRDKASVGSTIRERIDSIKRSCRNHEDCDASDTKNGELTPHLPLPSLKAQKYYTLHEASQHAMQTGVSLVESEQGHHESTKFLRAGINTVLCHHAAIVQILIDKGLFTEEEYAQAISKTMKEEQGRYEQLLGVKLG